jgi:hypothetical protein
MIKKKLFFGWTNIKWFITEIINLYTGKPSYFSKKRVESGIAFFIGQWGMIYFVIENLSKMTTSDMVLWAGVEFAVSGYMVNQIQKEKKNLKEDIEEEV